MEIPGMISYSSITSATSAASSSSSSSSSGVGLMSGPSRAGRVTLGVTSSSSASSASPRRSPRSQPSQPNSFPPAAAPAPAAEVQPTTGELSRLRTLQRGIARLLTDNTLETLADVIIVAENKEYRCHRALLSLGSGYFQRLFCSGEGASRIEFQQQWRVVRQLLLSMYGEALDPSLDAESLLELLTEIRNLEIVQIDPLECIQLIQKNLTPKNCVAVLLHDETQQHQPLIKQAVGFVARRFTELVSTPSTRSELLRLPRSSLILLLKELCRVCSSANEAEVVVRFTVDWSPFSSACDVLRDCKSWNWAEGAAPPVPANATQPNAQTQLPSGLKNAAEHPDDTCTTEWRLDDLKHQLQDQMPMKFVAGTFFDWCVRIDNGKRRSAGPRPAVCYRRASLPRPARSPEKTRLLFFQGLLLCRGRYP
eukprot:GHVT01096975.1.p1 GENE.GHVT01096975.1~~GHVT01096975.1.p1  ORF type:complete len:424 (+),score=73.34 GHVT01096975.1:1300-2571(+)